jgi:hypothetical protein
MASLHKMNNHIDDDRPLNYDRLTIEIIVSFISVIIALLFVPNRFI